MLLVVVPFWAGKRRVRSNAESGSRPCVPYKCDVFSRGGNNGNNSDVVIAWHYKHRGRVSPSAPAAAAAAAAAAATAIAVAAAAAAAATAAAFAAAVAVVGVVVTRCRCFIITRWAYIRARCGRRRRRRRTAATGRCPSDPDDRRYPQHLPLILPGDTCVLPTFCRVGLPIQSVPDSSVSPLPHGFPSPATSFPVVLGFPKAPFEIALRYPATLVARARVQKVF